MTGPDGKRKCSSRPRRSSRARALRDRGAPRARRRVKRAPASATTATPHRPRRPPAIAFQAFRSRTRGAPRGPDWSVRRRLPGGLSRRRSRPAIEERPTRRCTARRRSAPSNRAGRAFPRASAWSERAALIGRGSDDEPAARRGARPKRAPNRREALHPFGPPLLEVVVAPRRAREPPLRRTHVYARAIVSEREALERGVGVDHARRLPRVRADREAVGLGPARPHVDGFASRGSTAATKTPRSEGRTRRGAPPSGGRRRSRRGAPRWCPSRANGSPRGRRASDRSARPRRCRRGPTDRELPREIQCSPASSETNSSESKSGPASPALA